MVSEVLNDSDGIIQEILDNSEMSKEDLMEQIQKKIEEYGGLLTEAGAAYSIAKSMGIRKGKEKVIEDGEQVKLKEIEEGQSNIDVEARVKRVYMTREFSSSKNSGNVTNVDIKDETGEGRAVLWDKKELAQKLERNKPIRIVNGYVKKNNDRLEINVGRYGEVELAEGTEIPEVSSREKKVSELEEGMDDVDVYARVERVFPMNTFTKTIPNGEQRQGKVTNAVITDGEEETRLVLWGEHAEAAQKLSKNDLIKIEGGYVKKNRDRDEVHLGWRGRLKVNPETDKNIPEIKVNRKKIHEINQMKPGKEVETRATVAQVFDPKIMETCPECGAMLRQGECEEHGAPEKPSYMSILNVVLDDGTGTVRATAFRKNADRLLGKTAKELSENGEDLEKSKNNLLGQEKIFTGTRKHNEDYDTDDFIINSISEMNIEKEIEKIQN